MQLNMAVWGDVIKTGLVEKYAATYRELAASVMVRMRDDESNLLRQMKTLIKKRKLLARKTLTADIDGWTPVHACALRGSRKLLKVYLSAGIDINIAMGQPDGLPEGCSLLHMAALRGDVKVVEYLLTKGIFINSIDSTGATPIMYAAKRKHFKVVHLLAKHGASLSGVEFPVVNGGYDCISPQASTVKFCFF